MEAHDLARETEANAGAVGFGGEKGYEYLRLTLATNGCAIIDNVDAHGIEWFDCGYNITSYSSCLDGVTDEVDEYLRDLTFVGIEEDVVGFLDITTCDMGVDDVLRREIQHSINQLFEHEGSLDWRCHSGEGAIGVDKLD